MTLQRPPGEGEGRGKPSPQDYWELVISIGYGQTGPSIRLMTHRVGGLLNGGVGQGWDRGRTGVGKVRCGPSCLIIFYKAGVGQG